MRLSESGIQKFWQWACNDIKGDLKDLEFEQKDFKGTVLLSVREAQLIRSYLVRLPIQGNEKMAETVLIPLQFKIDEALEE